MTLNERLGTAGLLAEWDKAFRDRDQARMIAILQRVEADEAAAIQTVETVLKNPGLYGG